MKKKIIIIIVSILVLVGLITGGILLFGGKEEVKNFKDEYTLVSDDHAFEYKTSEEIIKILKNGTGIVYLGFKECPWCQHYAKILDELTQEVGIDVIYYYDIRQDREENNETYQEIVSLLKDHLDFDQEGNPRIFVPDVTFVKKGEIIYHTNETSMITENIKPEEYWTEEKTNQAKDTLKKYIKEINNKMCTDCNE